MCTESAHHTYVDILKGYHCITLSKVTGYTLILTISLLRWVDALVLLSTIYSIPGTGTVAEPPLCDREVVGSIPSQVIRKTLKMVLAALSLGAQH